MYHGHRPTGFARHGTIETRDGGIFKNEYLRPWIMNAGRKPLYFHPSCKKDYLSLPEAVQDDAGYNLDRVQQGKPPRISFGPLPHLGSGVMELRIDEDTDTYRVVYVAKLSEAVFVLDAFKKKSPRGKELPQNIEARIQSRYEQAKEMNKRLKQDSSN
jgi:phage-related protein